MNWWIWLVIFLVIFVILGLFLWTLFRNPEKQIVRNLTGVKIRIRLDQSIDPVIKDLIKLINQERPNAIDPGSIDLIEQVKSIPVQFCHLANVPSTSPVSSPNESDGVPIAETRRSNDDSPGPFPESSRSRVHFADQTDFDEEDGDEETGQLLDSARDLTGGLFNITGSVSSNGQNGSDSSEQEPRFKYALSVLNLLAVTNSPDYQKQEWRTDLDGNLIFRIKLGRKNWQEYYLILNPDGNSFGESFKLVSQIRSKMIPIKLVKINGHYTFYTLMINRMIFSARRRDIIDGIVQKDFNDFGRFLIDINDYVPRNNQVHLDLGISPA